MNIYNVTNHRLNGEKLRKLNEFSTDLYGGAIAPSSITNIFTYSNNIVSINSNALINDELYIICGGCLITLTQSDLPNTLENKVYYLTVLTDFVNDSIVSDESVNVSVEAVNYSAVDITTYSNTGQSISISGGFRIPLFRWDGSSFTSIVKSKDKSSSQDWLSQSAIADLWDTLNKTFVHQEGSTNAHPTYGTLGEFNIKANNITHNNSTFISATNDNKVKLNSDYVPGPAVINSNRELTSVSTLGVTLGGTGATERGQTLKNNLGIYWGATSPELSVTNPAIGDLYFKILS